MRHFADRERRHMDGSRAAPSNESDAPESGPRLERVDCARSGPSRRSFEPGSSTRRTIFASNNSPAGVDV